MSCKNNGVIETRSLLIGGTKDSYSSLCGSVCEMVIASLRILNMAIAIVSGQEEANSAYLCQGSEVISYKYMDRCTLRM